MQDFGTVVDSKRVFALIFLYPFMFKSGELLKCNFLSFYTLNYQY